jgi:hypothetical protein
MILTLGFFVCSSNPTPAGSLELKINEDTASGTSAAFVFRSIIAHLINEYRIGRVTPPDQPQLHKNRALVQGMYINTLTALLDNVPYSVNPAHPTTDQTGTTTSASSTGGTIAPPGSTNMTTASSVVPATQSSPSSSSSPPSSPSDSRSSTSSSATPNIPGSPDSPVPGAGSTSNHHSIPAAGIIGGVIGGIAFILFIGVAIAFIGRARRRRVQLPKEGISHYDLKVDPGPPVLVSIVPGMPRKKGLLAERSVPLGPSPAEKVPVVEEASEAVPERDRPDAQAVAVPVSSIMRTPSQSDTLNTPIASERRAQLQERQERNLMQLASLESRLNQSNSSNLGHSVLTPEMPDGEMVMVAREEHEATREEMSRLREENMWLREMQHSDWAMGLSDEMPPPYQTTPNVLEEDATETRGSYSGINAA